MNIVFNIISIPLGYYIGRLSGKMKKQDKDDVKSEEVDWRKNFTDEQINEYMAWKQEVGL